MTNSFAVTKARHQGRRMLAAGVALATALAMTIATAGVAGAKAVPDHGPTAGGTTVSITLPAPVTAVAAGGLHSLAVGADGRAYAWGSNANTQLGDGTSTNRLAPVQVARPAGVGSGFAFTAVAAGLFYSLALGNDGRAYAWGNNAYGQLGDGSTADRSVPVAVTTPVGVGPGFAFTAIAAGSVHSVALGNDGRAYTWGNNTYGQLGNGSTTNRSTPTAVATPVGVGPGFAFTAVTAGLSYSLALGNDGRAYAWGDNSYGQLGDGTTTDSTTPVAATTPAGVAPGFAFTAVAAGSIHSLARGNDGRAYAWGYNGSGQLGDGSTTNRSTPVAASTPSGAGAGFAFTTIAAGASYSLARGNDGRVYGWGAGIYGQLGDGSTTNRSTPVAASTPSGAGAGFAFTAIAAGGHSLALGNDSRVYAWGANDQGQLGDGTTDVRYVPVPAVASALPTLSVQTVLFGAKAGSKVTQLSARVFTVRTPKHQSGRVKVTVYWTAGGVARTPLVVSGGFDYGALASAKPTIKGKAAVGKTVKVKPKKAKWTSGASLAFQWKADGTKISGATGKKLALTKKLIGKKLTVTVTGTKKGYHPTTRTSKAVTVTR